MRVTITGASGHIGANLTRTLLAAGHRVTVLQRSRGPALAGLDLTEVRGDVRDADAVARSVAGAEAVFHLAGRVALDGGRDGTARTVNAGGTANVARACLRAGVARLVHFSSVRAPEPEPWDRPLDEARPLVDEAGALAYDASKAAAERAVGEAVREGLDAVVVIVEWTGFAVLTWSPAAAAFAFWTAANLVPRALANLRWYRRTFPDYPRSRRALVPFLL